MAREFLEMGTKIVLMFLGVNKAQQSKSEQLSCGVPYKTPYC